MEGTATAPDEAVGLSLEGEGALVWDSAFSTIVTLISAVTITNFWSKRNVAKTIDDAQQRLPQESGLRLSGLTSGLYSELRWAAFMLCLEELAAYARQDCLARPDCREGPALMIEQLAIQDWPTIVEYYLLQWRLAVLIRRTPVGPAPMQHARAEPNTDHDAGPGAALLHHGRAPQSRHDTILSCRDRIISVKAAGITLFTLSCGAYALLLYLYNMGSSDTVTFIQNHEYRFRNGVGLAAIASTLLASMYDVLRTRGFFNKQEAYTIVAVLVARLAMVTGVCVTSLVYNNGAKSDDNINFMFSSYYITAVFCLAVVLYNMMSAYFRFMHMSMGDLVADLTTRLIDLDRRYRSLVAVLAPRSETAAAGGAASAAGGYTVSITAPADGDVDHAKTLDHARKFHALENKYNGIRTLYNALKAAVTVPYRTGGAASGEGDGESERGTDTNPEPASAGAVSASAPGAGEAASAGADKAASADVSDERALEPAAQLPRHSAAAADSAAWGPAAAARLGAASVVTPDTEQIEYGSNGADIAGDRMAAHTILAADTTAAAGAAPASAPGAGEAASAGAGKAASADVSDEQALEHAEQHAKEAAQWRASLQRARGRLRGLHGGGPATLHVEDADVHDTVEELAVAVAVKDALGRVRSAVVRPDFSVRTWDEIENKLSKGAVHLSEGAEQEEAKCLADATSAVREAQRELSRTTYVTLIESKDRTIERLKAEIEEKVAEEKAREAARAEATVIGRSMSMEGALGASVSAIDHVPSPSPSGPDAGADAGAEAGAEAGAGRLTTRSPSYSSSEGTTNVSPHSSSRDSPDEDAGPSV